jgi:hypothetical protein
MTRSTTFTQVARALPQGRSASSPPASSTSSTMPSRHVRRLQASTRGNSHSTGSTTTYWFLERRSSIHGLALSQSQVKLSQAKPYLSQSPHKVGHGVGERRGTTSSSARHPQPQLHSSFRNSCTNIPFSSPRLSLDFTIPIFPLDLRRKTTARNSRTPVLTAYRSVRSTPDSFPSTAHLRHHI